METRTVTIGHKPVEAGALIRFIGIIAFFLLLGLIVYLIWPHLKGLFQPGGVEAVMNEVDNAGPLGVFVLLGLQILQIVVAFIPGEFVQIAAGMLYGPWLGAVLVIGGSLVASAFLFVLVKRLGLPFVQSVAPAKLIDKFQHVEASGRLKVIVFTLFLIPGLPKDILTYLVPLTGMKMRDYLIYSHLGRIPGVLVSTYVANGLVEGNVTESIVVFSIAAVIAIIGMLNRTKLMNLMNKVHDKVRPEDSDKRANGTRSAEDAAMASLDDSQHDKED